MLTQYTGKKFINFLLKNKEYIETKAIKNCHALGLHSFILDEDSTVRLFIADETCVLRHVFDHKNPIVPIHGHKHDEYFVPLFKNSLIHHVYEKIIEYGDNYDDSIEVCLTTHIYGRLDGIATQGLIGSDVLSYKGGFDHRFLKGNILHTVSIPTTGKSAWLVIQSDTNDLFDQVGYGEKSNLKGLYQPFENPVDYIKEYLSL